MTEFNKLKAIIISLSDFERESVLRSFALNNQYESSHSLSFRLVNLMVNNKELNVDDLYLELYNNVKTVALKKLVQRVFDRVLDLLISKEVVSDNSIYESKTMVVFNIRRKLFHYDILVTHGLFVYALPILNQVIKLSIKFEIYDYLIIALEKKLIKMSLKKGVKEYQKVFDSIIHFNDCNNSLRKARYILRLCSADYNYNQKVINIEKLPKAINEISKDYARTKSKSLYVVLCYIKNIYYYYSEQYEKAKLVLKELLKFVNSNNGIINSLNKLSCQLNIAECDFMMMRFNSALNILLESSKKYLRNNYNSSIIKEMVFLNYFYIGNLKLSSEYINLLIRNRTQKKESISEFIYSKWLFYNAIVLFINQEFIKANKLIVHCRKLESDKDGWNIGLRVFSIIINIELEKYSYVESQIENLRKHISRVKGENVFIRRNILILKILNDLIYNSFDFNKTFKRSEELLNKLSGDSNNYQWKLKSPEMILFHEWFDAKVKGIPYNHTEIMSRLRKKHISKR